MKWLPENSEVQTIPLLFCSGNSLRQLFFTPNGELVQSKPSTDCLQQVQDSGFDSVVSIARTPQRRVKPQKLIRVLLKSPHHRACGFWYGMDSRAFSSQPSVFLCLSSKRHAEIIYVQTCKALDINMPNIRRKHMSDAFLPKECRNVL